MGGGFSGGGHVVSEEAPLIRTTLSSTSAIQRRVVILHTPQFDCVTGLPQNNPDPTRFRHGRLTGG